MADKHSVESHLNLDLAEYDRLIRVFIPGYDTMVRTLVDWLDALLPHKASLLELGPGTGRLTHALVEAFPESLVEAWDIDPKVFAEAEKRLGSYKGQVTFREKSFSEPIPKCDAVVASLSLHHVPDPKAKLALYRNIHGGLAPGGVFLSADAVVSEDPRIRELTFERWAAHMGKSGVTREQAYRHFADWAKEDKYLPLAEELRLLTEAGFRQPECFWRGDAVAVFGAVKR